MAGGTCRTVDELPERAFDLVKAARRAVLATIDASGRPHAVPVCFALRGLEVVTAVDHKPKRSVRLGRVGNVDRTGVATLLIDRWDEDWTRLAWVMIRGRARVEPPGTAVDELQRRYEQYREQPPEGPVIVLAPDRVTWWRWA